MPGETTRFSAWLEGFYNDSLGGAVGQIFYTLAVLMVGGICEVGGGWLVWQVLRVGKSVWLLIPAAVILVLYGVIMTLQMLQFSRAFATYGGVFILVSLLWGWVVDKHVPDRWDWIGAGIAVLGVGVVAFVPRKATE
ncbi:YnfA family protein [Powellomyces hirtus]|nr:YnfA family protein [Powellomyces hirtus]